MGEEVAALKQPREEDSKPSSVAREELFAEVQQIATDLASIVNTYDVSSSDEASKESLFTRGLLNVLHLRQCHRLLCESVDALREETTASKGDLDTWSLHLQNLLYEKHHYQREIKSCRAYVSAYSEQELELIPEEEFLKLDIPWNEAKEEQEITQGRNESEPGHISMEDDEGPEEGEQIATPVVANGKEHGDTALPYDESHDIMLRRLRHEVELREAKRKELDELKTMRDTLAAELATKRGILDGIEHEVKKLKTLVVEAEESFGMNGVQEMGGSTDALALLLPPPLFVLYSHMKSAAETTCVTIASKYDIDISVSIGGDEAATLLDRLQGGLVMSSPKPYGGDSSKYSDLRKSMYDDIDVGSDEPFPLSVNVTLSSKAKRFTFTFTFCPGHGITRISGETPEDRTVIQELYPDADGGKQSTNGAVSSGYAFGWVQMLCGINLLPSGWKEAQTDQLMQAIQKYQSESSANSVLMRLIQCCHAHMA